MPTSLLYHCDDLVILAILVPHNSDFDSAV